ncbi:MAG: DUF134 domain-containing protein [Deltaproteobacteria bacterium]|nr:DUF134 domain-containing protein [Deltaproteobacteria bacterium]
MSRPKKKRLCEGRLCGRSFKPARIPMTKLRKIHLLRDELETLKLCDMEEMTQEEAGRKMGISRGTVQRMLTRARQKVTAEPGHRSAAGKRGGRGGKRKWKIYA